MRLKTFACRSSTAHDSRYARCGRDVGVAVKVNFRPFKATRLTAANFDRNKYPAYPSSSTSAYVSPISMAFYHTSRTAIYYLESKAVMPPKLSAPLMACLDFKHKPRKGIRLEKSCAASSPLTMNLIAWRSNCWLRHSSHSSRKPRIPTIQFRSSRQTSRTLLTAAATKMDWRRGSSRSWTTLSEAARRPARPSRGKSKEPLRQRSTTRKSMAFCTLIVLGTLIMTAPLVVQALGFGALGPVEGRSAVHKKPLPFQLINLWTLSQLAGKNDTQVTFQTGRSFLASSD